MPSPSPSFSAIIPAAGMSLRFGRDKLLEPLAGLPIIARALAPFLSRSDVAQIIIPTNNPDPLRSALHAANIIDPRIHFCPGGPHRAQSVRSALDAISPTVDWIAVHDAARPFLSQDLIDRTFATAQLHGAAVPAQSVHLTIKQADGPLPARVQRTVPRHSLWAMQTPQFVSRVALQNAYESCPIPLDQITDDVQLIELAGGEVWLVEGDPHNIKITTPLDLQLATLILSQSPSAL